MAAKGSVGIPSAKGMGSAFGDFAVGMGGGLAYSLATSIFGSGLFGAIACPVLAGSVIKGQRGSTIATMAGFLMLSGALGGGGSEAAAAPSSEVM